jgi:glycosyltransferase involved in cell wall biosynthesis
MSRRSRVLHILKYYRPTFTGEGVFMERCTAFMNAEAPHIEHDLLVTHTPEPDRKLAICSTLQSVHYLVKRPLSGWRHEFVLLLWCIRNLHRYDTIHVRTHADWYFAAYLLAKLMRRRLILSATLDDSVPVLIKQYRDRLQPLARWVFRMFDGFVSISPKLQRETISCVAPEKCHLLPCGVDLLPLNPALGQRTRTQLGIPPDALVLIFVGGLCRRKDPSFLVRHMPAILRRRPDAWLLLVGPNLEPDYVTDIQEFLRDEGITERVVFIGEVQDPHPYFDAADIMTFASQLEGFGTVVPEAMAHALPVVVRHLPGVNDLFVRDGETGFFFTEDTAYLAAVLRLAEDPALRREIGLRGRALVHENFDMIQVARRYLRIYGLADSAETPAPATGDDVLAEVRQIPASSSVLNPRFHVPADIGRIRQPLLLTIIDAEEAFDWNQPFTRAATDVSSMTRQGPAHRIFERFGVIPTYMVDYPVVSHDDGRIPLLEMLRSGRCDIGTQLHPWVSPPFLEDVTNRNSYPGNLSLALEFEKLWRLTDAIEAAFDLRPRIYRAGRYGIGPRTGDLLRHLGYLADTSVMSGWDFTDQGGPDYTRISTTPYWIDDDRTVLEIPCTAAIVGGLGQPPEALRRAVFAGPSERVGLPSLTAHLRLLERIKLTPEGITVPEAKRLIRHMLANGQKVFVLTYHTPSLVPGNTPYVRNQRDLDRLLGWLEEVYAFFTTEVGGRCVRWHEVRDALLDVPAPTPQLATADAAAE